MKQPPFVINIPTRNRPAGLRRCASSYLDHIASAHTSVTLLVLDNSTEASFFSQNASVVQDLQSSYNVPIEYIDRARREAMAESVHRTTGLPLSIVRFAFFGDERCGHSYGACRNALQFLSTGRYSVQVDDDTRCKPASASSSPGLALSAKDTPEVYLPIPGSSKLPESSGVDLIHEHNGVLGQSALAVLGDSLTRGIEPNISQAHPQLIERVSHPNTTIATTYLGTAGDSGMQGHAFRLFEEGPTREQLLTSAQSFEQLMTTRWMIKAVPQTTISNSPHCMTIHIGLDTRNLLPPFMPVMRNEDGVFGAVKQVCFPHYLSAYLPYTIQHLPPEDRPAPSLDEALRSPNMRLNDLVCQLVLYGKEELGEAPSLKTLGEYLLEITSSSPDSFRSLLQAKAHQTRQNIIAFATQQLEAFKEAPDFWVRGVQTYIDSLKQPAESFAPADLEGSFEDRWTLCQDLIHQYATLLTYWETIFEAGKELSQ